MVTMLSEHGDIKSVAVAAYGGQPTRRSRERSGRGTLAILGLLAVTLGVLGVSAGAAGAPGAYVPARSGGWPSWLHGPLHALGLSLSSGSFQAWTLAMCAGYAAALAGARALSGRTIAVAIGACYALLLLGPPLISQDVFGYLSFARLGVLHGLDPYTHVAAEAPADAVFAFIGWPFQHSPYGPLFTLATYPLASIGLAGGLWALKALAVAASAGAVALIALAAGREGRSAKLAAVFVGLNPVTLELAIGGAHNDTLVLLVLAGALAASVRRDSTRRDSTRRDSAQRDSTCRDSARQDSARQEAPRLRKAAAALAVGVGIKASAGLVLPYAVLAPPRWSERARVAASALIALALLAVIAIAGFGTHALGFLDALGEQQQLIATHSIPAETARWLGMRGVPRWWREVFGAGLIATLAITLWATARGADWRTMAGWATLALLLSTAWLLPWYAIWALPLAALGDNRRLRIATLLVCAYAIAIHLPLADPLLSPARQLAHHRVR